MKKSIFFSLILFTLTPVLSYACSPKRILTNSLEPVTIKIADTYFQIPEGYLQYPFLRIPMEREHIQFSFPVTVLLPSLTSERDRKKTVLVKLFKNSIERIKDRGIPVSTKVNTTFSELEYQRAQGFTPDLVINYLNSISSQTPPKTWLKDSILTKKLRMGGTPCSKRKKRHKPIVLKLVNYRYIIEGLTHRNETIRSISAYKAVRVEPKHQTDAVKKLKDRLEHEKSKHVIQSIEHALSVLEKAE